MLGHENQWKSQLQRLRPVFAHAAAASTDVRCTSGLCPLLKPQVVLEMSILPFDSHSGRWSASTYMCVSLQITVTNGRRAELRVQQETGRILDLSGISDGIHPKPLMIMLGQ